MSRFNKEEVRSILNALLTLIIAVVTLEATFLVQYYFSRKTIWEEAIGRAEGHLEATNLQVSDVLNQVETAVRNNVWAVRKVLDSPDSLAFLTTRIVENNDFISGSAIAFVENYYPEKGRMFSPYTYREDGVVKETQLGTETYNYLEKEWFTMPLEQGSGYWSEPYFDSGGGKMFMTTYSVPVTDNDGQVVAVLTSDISLDWLTGLVGGIQVYPGAFGIIVSRKGQFMVCPVPSLVVRNTVQEAAESIPETVVRDIAQSMLAGERGRQLVHYRGDKVYTFYAPIDRAGWSMAIVVPYDEIYGDVRKVGLLVVALQLIGLLLMAYILWSAAKNRMRFQDVSQKKNRIESELHIARDIQMAMLPMTFPTYPESIEIDRAGTIVPAKEVGGDRYEFFQREDKMYFSIGDVSGKGVPASLVMAVTRSLFRSVSARETSPQRIVAQMNDSMAETNENNMFVTFFLGVLDLRTGHLRYCNAGHNAPVRMGPGAASLLDVVPNLPLGVEPGVSYVEQEIDLSTGEGLYLYTDGLTEAENADHVLFGEENLLKAVLRHAGDKASAQLHAMTTAVKAHTRGFNPSDDLTMLIVRFTNPSPSSSSERHLVLRNQIKELSQLAGFMGTIAAETGMDRSLATSLNLALEEAVSNVILYAYPAGTSGLVDVDAVVWKDHIDFVVSDSGIPFDPTVVGAPDLTLDVKERPIGGLGIFLVKSIMDHVSYSRREGKNILSMTKKL